VELLGQSEKLICVDNSAAMLNALNDKLEIRTNSDVEILRSSMGRTEINTGAVGLLVEYEAFFLFPDLVTLAAEIRRVLSSDGLVVRLLRENISSQTAKDVVDAFDRVIRQSVPQGLFFVGEHADALLDHELERVGFMHRRIHLFNTVEIQTFEDLLEPRMNLAFPYLQGVAGGLIERAVSMAASLAGHGQKLEVGERYSLIVNFPSHRVAFVDKMFSAICELDSVCARGE
jgi:hypothetical protein